jgi:hypothetical protein
MSDLDDRKLDRVWIMSGLGPIAYDLKVNPMIYCLISLTLERLNYIIVASKKFVKLFKCFSDVLTDVTYLTDVTTQEGRLEQECQSCKAGKRLLSCRIGWH